MATTNRLFQDFISFVTDTDPGSGGTSLSAPGLADLLVVADPDFIALTLDPEEDNGAPEIVWVSAHSSSATTATIVRAQEGTAARAHPISTVVVAGATAEALGVFALVTGGISDPTLSDPTSAYQAAASVSFTKPAGWNTYSLLAWGQVMFEGTAGGQQPYPFVKITGGGATSSTEGHPMENGELSFANVLSTSGRTSASTTIKIEYKNQNDGSSTLYARHSTIQFIAVRES